MKILLTGSRGLIGRYLEKQLIEDGHEVIGFDLSQGNDISDSSSLIRAGKGCNVIVHLAALLGNDDIDSAEEITRTNLLGTFNVLEAARINKINKVIYMSSADALGIFKGEGDPSYFPIDDYHPCRPATPYAISKKLSEEMCETFTKINRIPTICLRPPGVWEQQTYRDIVEARKIRPEYEWDPYWEYGAFIDVRDLVEIVIRCIEVDFKGHECYLVSSDDIQTSGYTNIELIKKVHPKVELKDKARFEIRPNESIIDCRRVKEKFGWKPKYTWSRFLIENEKKADKEERTVFDNFR